MALAIIEATQLGKFRTAAASAVAAKYLSPAGASRVLSNVPSAPAAMSTQIVVSAARPSASETVFS